MTRERRENGPEPFSDGTEKDRRGIESSDLPKLYPNLVFRQGNPEIKQVALTFDDGPDDTFTPQILDILRDMDVRATFFITGVRGEEFPGGLKRISREGHSLQPAMVIIIRILPLCPEGKLKLTYKKIRPWWPRSQEKPSISFGLLTVL